MVSGAFGSDLQTPDLQEMSENGKHPATGLKVRLSRMWMGKRSHMWGHQTSTQTFSM